MSEAFPTEIFIESKNQPKTVLITPEIEAVLPEIAIVFDDADEAYEKHPLSYLQRLERSVFSFNSKTGAEIACSLIFNSDDVNNEILVMYAPFSDGPPTSSAETIYSYVTADEPDSKADAKPNTWNQITKSAVVSDVLSALGRGMPVLTIFSPIPPSAYNKAAKNNLKNGEFEPAGEIGLEAVGYAQQILHGQKTETQIDIANLWGASLGASNAIGAAEVLINSDFSVPSLTAQELIMGPHNVGETAKRFIKPEIDSSLLKKTPAASARLADPIIRQEIDRNGSEPAAYIRVVQAMKKNWSSLRGLSHPGLNMVKIERALENKTSVLIALAENSALTHQTKDVLASYGKGSNDIIKKSHIITVRGEGEQKAAHLIDEHVALTSLVAVLGIIKADLIQNR